MATPCEEAWKKRYRSPDEALEEAEAAEKKARSEADERKALQAELIRLFIRFMRRGEKELLPSVDRIARSFERDGLEREAAIAHDLLARIADAHGAYGKGSEEVLKGLSFAEQVDDPELEAELLATKANLLNRTGDHAQAIEELERCLEIRRSIGDEMGIAAALNQLARSHTLNGEAEKALSYYEKSREWREQTGDKGGLPWTYLGMGTAYEQKGEIDASLEWFDRALASNEQRIPILELLVRSGKGRIRHQQGAEEEASKELEEALQLAEQIDSDPLRTEVLDALYKVEQEAGRTERALELLERYNQLRERIIEEQSKDRMRHQEQAFQAEKKEKEAEIERLRNVELKEAYDALEEKNKEIRDSLNYASRIQSGLLPEDQMLATLFPEHFVLFQPRDVVSGDFYWAGSRSSEEGVERRYFVAADCTGHGVPGAFMSMLGVTFLNELILEKGYSDPGEILDRLRDRIAQTLNPSENKGRSDRKDGMDLTLIAYEPATHALHFAGANNPLYLIRRSDAPIPEGYDRCKEGEKAFLYEFKVDRQSVGASDRMEPFSSGRLVLEKGDRVHLLSDGYPDQFGGKQGKKFKYRRLKEFLLEHVDEPMVSQKEQLEKAFEEWRDGHEQIDDVIVCGIRF